MNFATPEELKKYRRLVVWECHHCGTPVFGNSDKLHKCPNCYHMVYASDKTGDSHDSLKYTDVGFTLEGALPWDQSQPQIIAWFNRSCPACNKEVWEPYRDGMIQKHACKPTCLPPGFDLNYEIQALEKLVAEMNNELSLQIDLIDRLATSLGRLRKMSAEMSEKKDVR